MLTLAEKINAFFELPDYDRLHIFKGSSAAGRNMTTFSPSQLKAGTPAEILEHLLDSCLADKPEPKDWNALCEKFLIGCISYTHFDGSYMPDAVFDVLSKELHDDYTSLPQWFRDRVPLTNLSAGTALGLEYTEEEITYVKEMTNG